MDCYWLESRLENSQHKILSHFQDGKRDRKYSNARELNYFPIPFDQVFQCKVNSSRLWNWWKHHVNGATSQYLSASKHAKRARVSQTRKYEFTNHGSKAHSCQKSTFDYALFS